MRIFLVVVAFLISFQASFAQVQLPDAFSNLLSKTQLDFHYPLEGKYKVKKVGFEPYESYDFAIRSRKEKIEIRYAIYPFEEKDLASIAPHAACVRLVTHLATNDDHALISSFSLSEESLLGRF